MLDESDWQALSSRTCAMLYEALLYASRSGSYVSHEGNTIYVRNTLRTNVPSAAKLEAWPGPGKLPR